VTQEASDATQGGGAVTGVEKAAAEGRANVRPMQLRALLLLAPLALVACAKSAPTESIEPVPAAPAPQAQAPTGPLRLGEPISASVVSLKDVAARPADFKGKTITTNGVVTAVCQEMGCWMEIKDDSGQAHIKMHGHKFFVPRTAPGHHARVQATVVAAKDAEGAECDEEAAQQMGHPVAKIELDATGVEID
jgi:hypothetical protein